MVTVDFDVPVGDVPVDGSTVGFGVQAMFAGGTSIALFAPYQFLSVTPDGTTSAVVEYPRSPASDQPAIALDAAQGPDGFGGIMAFDLSPVDIRFCPFDATGVMTLASCTSLSLGASGGRVWFDGDGYQVAAVRSGVTHRWQFSSAGVLLGEDDLWSLPAGEDGVLAADGSLDWRVVLNAGPHAEGCATIAAHTTSTAGEAVTDLLPPSFKRTSGLAFSADETRAAVVFRGECVLDGPGACTGDPPSHVSFLAFFESGVAAVPPAPIPLPDTANLAASVDGTVLEVVYAASPGPSLWLAGFGAPPGGQVWKSTLLPLAYQTAGNSLSSLYAVDVIGPGDLAIVYTLFDSVGAPHTRLARVHLTGG